MNIERKALIKKSLLWEADNFFAGNYCSEPPCLGHIQRSQPPHGLGGGAQGFWQRNLILQGWASWVLGLSFSLWESSFCEPSPFLLPATNVAVPVVGKPSIGQVAGDPNRKAPSRWLVSLLSLRRPNLGCTWLTFQRATRVVYARKVCTYVKNIIIQCVCVRHNVEIDKYIYIYMCICVSAGVGTYINAFIILIPVLILALLFLLFFFLFLSLLFLFLLLV